MSNTTETPEAKRPLFPTKYKCPCCTGTLVYEHGSRVRTDLGVTLFCPSTECPAQEVMGYGKDPAAAFKIVTERFNHRIP